MQRTIKALVLSCWILGCAEDKPPKDMHEAQMSSEADAAVGGKDCDARAIQDQAMRLAQQAAACRQDSECALEMIEGACLSAFLCSVPVNRKADLVELRAEAARLSAEYKQCPSFSCAQASCAGSLAAKCDQATHFCKWVKPE